MPFLKFNLSREHLRGGIYLIRTHFADASLRANPERFTFINFNAFGGVLQFIPCQIEEKRFAIVFRILTLQFDFPPDFRVSLTPLCIRNGPQSVWQGMNDHSRHSRNYNCAPHVRLNSPENSLKDSVN